MLAVMISVLFGFTAAVSMLVVRASFGTGVRRARAIVAELAAIERRERVALEPRIPSRVGPGAAPLRFAAA